MIFATPWVLPLHPGSPVSLDTLHHLSHLSLELRMTCNMSRGLKTYEAMSLILTTARDKWRSERALIKQGGGVTT